MSAEDNPSADSADIGEALVAALGFEPTDGRKPARRSAAAFDDVLDESVSADDAFLVVSTTDPEVAPVGEKVREAAKATIDRNGSGSDHGAGSNSGGAGVAVADDPEDVRRASGDDLIDEIDLSNDDSTASDEGETSDDGGQAIDSEAIDAAAAATIVDDKATDGPETGKIDADLAEIDAAAEADRATRSASGETADDQNQTTRRSSGSRKAKKRRSAKPSKSKASNGPPKMADKPKAETSKSGDGDDEALTEEIEMAALPSVSEADIDKAEAKSKVSKDRSSIDELLDAGHSDNKSEPTPTKAKADSKPSPKADPKPAGTSSSKADPKPAGTSTSKTGSASSANSSSTISDNTVDRSVRDEVTETGELAAADTFVDQPPPPTADDRVLQPEELAAIARAEAEAKRREADVNEQARREAAERAKADGRKSAASKPSTSPSAKAPDTLIDPAGPPTAPPLKEQDPAIADIIRAEVARQVEMLRVEGDPRVTNRQLIPPANRLELRGDVDEDDLVTDDSVSPAAVPSRSTSLPSIFRRKRRVQARKVRRVVRHIDPWSVLTFSVLFHLCVYGALLLASVLVWNAADAAGTIENLEDFIQELGDYERFEINGDDIFQSAVAIAGILTLASSVMLVLLTVVFNLISDLVGGIRMTVIEEETVRVRRKPRS